jgi:hypothetical protein
MITSCNGITQSTWYGTIILKKWKLQSKHFVRASPINRQSTENLACDSSTAEDNTQQTPYPGKRNDGTALVSVT